MIVEWLNVSGGIDAPAVWFMAHREIARAGYGYVAVSAQRVGIEGGPSLVGDASLKTLDPQRYSELDHPGDNFAYDIFTQVGQAVRAGVIDGLVPQFVLAAGESQSATFLTTYVNEVDPAAGVYDGFLIHSRFGSAAPLDGTSLLDESGAFHTLPVPFRADVRVPVLTVITETDLLGARLLGYVHARVPDTEHLRVWEIPGSAHADNYTIGVGFIDNGAVPLDQIVAAYAPTNNLMGQQLPHFINFAPQHHYVLQAAIAGLHDWVRSGRPAPSAPQIALTGTDPPAIALDADGVATGGLRTRGWMSRVPAHPAPAPTTTCCWRSSARVSLSIPRRWPGCTRVGGPSIWSGSPRRWMRRSAAASCSRRTAWRSSSSPPRLSRLGTSRCPVRIRGSARRRR